MYYAYRLFGKTLTGWSTQGRSEARFWPQIEARVSRNQSHQWRRAAGVIFQMAEVAVPRILFREILDRIRRLRFLTIPARPGWCVELLKIGFWNPGQQWRYAKTVRKSGFFTQICRFSCVFCDRDAEPAGKLLTMRWNLGIVGLELYNCTGVLQKEYQSVQSAGHLAAEHPLWS